MSYLGTLIASARGLPQGLQPRLAARFENPVPAPEPGLADGPLNESAAVALPAAPTVTPRSTAPQRAAPHPDGQRPAPAPTPTENLTAPREAPPPAQPWLPSQAHPVAASHTQHSAPAAATRPSPLARATPASSVSSTAPAAVASAETPAAAGAEPPWAPAARPPADQPKPPQPQAAAAPPARPIPRSPVAEQSPTIRVTIGRIDVRADPTPPKTPARANAARPAGDSALTRYLNQRGRP